MLDDSFFERAYPRLLAIARAHMKKYRGFHNYTDDLIQEAQIAIFKQNQVSGMTEEDAFSLASWVIRNKLVDKIRKKMRGSLPDPVSGKLFEDETLDEWVSTFSEPIPSFEEDIIHLDLLKKLLDTAIDKDVESLEDYLLSDKKDPSLKQSLKRFRDKWQFLFRDNPRRVLSQPKWRVDVHLKDSKYTKSFKKLAQARHAAKVSKKPATIYKLDEIWVSFEKYNKGKYECST